MPLLSSPDFPLKMHSKLGKSYVTTRDDSFPLFPDKQVRVTKNISTVDKHQSANILSGISDVLGLSKLVSSRNNQEGESKLSK
ncbi:hypothetical protein HUJ05_005149 [Dendroctonus ponderosae]|nr:hypothetical protein HUJ05_005149 [Dendroctonus ponderosae]